MKKVFNLFTLIALVLFIGYLATYAAKPSKNVVAIHFLNVGQGDSTYIEIPHNQNVLIDGGPVGNAERELDKYRPFYVREIKNLIITHPHLDHFGGLIDIVKDNKIDNIYMTKAVNDTDEYGQFIGLIKAKNITIHYVKKGDEIIFQEGIKLRFLSPETTDYRPENVNNTSIVTELLWGQKKALFMGDLEADEQYKMLEEVSKVDLIKVSHHCSADAFDQRFYDKIMPTYAVISVGKENSFGHPAKSCLDTLKSSKVYRTDKEGDINFDLSQETITAKP